eukprot:6199301-Pleurochrysis_carterae.AAC.1
MRARALAHALSCVRCGGVLTMPWRERRSKRCGFRSLRAYATAKPSVSELLPCPSAQWKPRSCAHARTNAVGPHTQ